MEKDAYNEAVKHGGRLRDEGKITEAVELLKGLTIEAPQWVAAFLVLGHVLWDEKRLDEAGDAFVSAMKLSPKLEIASLGRFHTLWESGRHEEAIEEIRRFQTVSDSEDYRKILNELGKNSD